jgi:hypothetical protein
MVLDFRSSTPPALHIRERPSQWTVYADSPRWVEYFLLYAPMTHPYPCNMSPQHPITMPPVSNSEASTS